MCLEKIKKQEHFHRSSVRMYLIHMDSMWLVNDVSAVKCFVRDKSERKVALRGRGERAVELETGGNVAQKNKNR